MRRSLPILLMGVGLWALGVLAAAAPEERKADDAPPPGKVITNAIRMKLAYIPAGKFMMGSPADEAEREDAELRHEVEITRPFYIGVYEVTQREFNQLMGKSVRQPAIFDERRGGGPDHPRENVRWREAV